MKNGSDKKCKNNHKIWWKMLNNYAKTIKSHENQFSNSCDLAAKKKYTADSFVLAFQTIYCHIWMHECDLVCQLKCKF